MNIIKRIYLWWKALRDSLTDAQFVQLCEACANDMTGAEASIMRTYLCHNVPAGERIRQLYINGEGLSRMYLKFLYKRDVTEQEQYYLVNFMKWQPKDIWPCELSVDNINELFDTEMPYKIAMYAAKYSLPEKYEIMLLNRCVREDETERKDKKSYYHVLKTYVMCGDVRQKFRSKKSQQALLAFNDNKIFKRIIKQCTIDENYIHPEVIDEMVKDDKVDLLRLILRESFIESAECRDAIAARFFSLKPLIYISVVRKEIRKIELQAGMSFGALFPFEDEAEYILQSAQYDLSNVQGRQAFIYALTPLMEGHPSPHLCAWVAYHFPELSDLACRKVRQLGEKLIKEYR
ncbi:MAG: hypothetical protein J6N49_00435 [Alphaproteobacteria bacterium]|nr:hypothetical protein [Alphaproteobacteria bacterium]